MRGWTDPGVCTEMALEIQTFCWKAQEVGSLCVGTLSG